MKHVIISPHLDDAVLSCGGVIHHRVKAGDSVLVITIFTGDAATHGVPEPLSPFALLQHTYWGSHPRPMTLRRAEDAAALSLLGAEWYHLGYLDAVYRRGADDAWLYDDLDVLFGQLKADDPMDPSGKGLGTQLAGFVPRTEPVIVYAPLAVGRHVDHQIVHAAACHLVGRGYRVGFYEDYPYADRPGALETGLQAAGAAGWRAEVLGLDAADVGAWANAVGYYRSQLGILFRGAEAMLSQVWSFAASRSAGGGLAARIWWPTEG